MSDHIINFTDPLRTSFNIRPYTSNGNRFPTSSTRAPSATASNSVLLLHGKGHPEYGERTNEHLLHLAENFSGASAPIISGDASAGSTLTGVIWHRERLYHFTGGVWYRWVFGSTTSSPTSDGAWSSSFSPTFTGTTTPTGPSNGDTWYDGTFFREYSSDIRGIDQWLVREFSTGTLPASPEKTLLVNHNGDPTDWSEILETSTASGSFLSITGGTLTGNLNIGAGSPTPIELTTSGDITASGDLTVAGNATLSGSLQITSSIIRTTISNYESSLSDDDDIPNKKYVDDVAASVSTDLYIVSGSFTTGVLTLNYNGGSPASFNVIGFDADQIPFDDTSVSITATEVQTAIEQIDTFKAPLASPTFTGVVTVPALTGGSGANEAANKAYVDGAIGGVGGDTYVISGSFLGGTLTLNYNIGSPSSFAVTGFNALQIPFTPTGNIAATDVQTALAEVDTEKVPFTGGTFTGGVIFNSAAVYNNTATFNQGVTASNTVNLSGATTVTVPSLTGASSANEAADKGYIDTTVALATASLISETYREIFTPVVSGSPAGDIPHQLPFTFSAGSNKLMVFRNGVKLYNDVYAFQDVNFNQSLTSTTTLASLPSYSVVEYLGGSPSGWVISGVHTLEFSVGDVIRVDNGIGIPFQQLYTVVGAPSLVGSPATNTFIPITPVGGETVGPQNPSTSLGINYIFDLNLDGGGATTIGISGNINGNDVTNVSDLITSLTNTLIFTFGAGTVSSYLFSGNLRFQSLNPVLSSGSIALSQGTASPTEYLFSGFNLGSIFGFSGLNAPTAGAEYGYYESSASGSPYTRATFGQTVDTIVLTVPSLQSTDVIEVLAT